MTISSTTASISYVGNGVTTAFPTTFVFFGDDEIEVIERVIATGAETTKALTTDYTVTGGAGATGTVTAVVAPPSTVEWHLRRATNRLQGIDYTANDQFPAETHELGLDRAAARDQEIDADVVRTPKFAKTDPASSLGDYPSSIVRASKFASYDSAGKPSASTGVTGIPISAAMTPVVQVASLAAGRTALAVPLDLSVMYGNRLINGEFRFFQTGLPGTQFSIADAAYGVDRWYSLSQTASVNVTTVDTNFANSQKNIWINQTNAAAQRFGLAQAIEAANCIDLRNGQVTLSGKARASAALTLLYAILEWTGTKDQITRDVVNDWNSVDYADGPAKFFVDAGYIPRANGSIALAANVAAEITPQTVALGNTFNNLVVVFWTEAAQAQNVILELANVALTPGSAAPAVYTPRPYGLELALCQRYLSKTFPVDTRPVQNSGVRDGAFTLGQTVGAGLPEQGVFTTFPVEMRAVPTVTTFNPNAANAQPRNFEIGADCSAISVGGVSALTSRRGVFLEWTTAAGSGGHQANGVHWLADAEL